MKIILGDNQFFGVNHFDLEKGATTKLKFDTTKKIEAFINDSLEIGIDGFIQHVTGDISRVILKDQNETIQKGDALFTLVNKGKQLTIKAPISGVIRAFNSDLISNSKLVQKMSV